MKVYGRMVSGITFLSGVWTLLFPSNFSMTITTYLIGWCLGTLLTGWWISRKKYSPKIINVSELYGVNLSEEGKD